MATISEPADVTAGVAETVVTDRDREGVGTTRARVAWLTVAIGGWMVGAIFLLLWATLHGADPDLLASIYSVPFYSGLVTLAAVAVALVLRAVRQRRGWRSAFPPAYGVLGAGVVALLAGLVADVGWREGVGITGIEGLLAPTRLLIVVGLILVAAGPLRSALRFGADVPRWPAVFSACLILAALGLPGGFHPAANPWLERAPAIANAEIWLMDGDGAHQTRLIEARDGFMAWNPVWSPDGKHLAYTRLRLGDRPPVDIPDEADIWVAAADGSDAHPLVDRPGWQWLPHWSPDGAWIVYTDEPEGGPWAAAGPAGLGGGGLFGTGFEFGSSNPVRTHADIWRVRADGTGSPERVTDEPGDDRAATFSPDGTRLVFDATRAGGTDIFVMNVNGSDVRQLTFDHGSDWGATWSPDGTRIAFSAWRSGNTDLYVMGADGSAATRLTTDPADDLEPAWSPDGRRIVFRRLRGPPDGGEIWSVAAGGGDERELSRDPGATDDLTSGGGTWATDGRIAYLRAENPPADADSLVRSDLASAAMLLSAIALAFIAVLLASIAPPFGAFGILIGIPTALFAAAADSWPFIPAAVVGGLVVDVLIRFAPDRWKVAVAGSGSAVALVVGAEVTVAMTAGVGWSVSLLAGVVVAAAAIGWALGEVVGRRPRQARETAS